MERNRTLSRRVGTGLTLVAACLAASFALSGCDSKTEEPAAANPADATIIDVRAEDEYAEGHLEGAININIRDTDFESRINDLPRDGHYLIYCRSGARSAMAVSQMEAAGFTDVIGVGGIDNATKTLGLPIVT